MTNAILFDTETTGLHEPQPTEAAWLRFASFAQLFEAEEYVERFKPGKPIELGALATSHILPHELENCRSHTEFLLPGGIDYLVGQNIDYDWKVAGCPDVKRICTRALAKLVWPDLDSYTQSALLYHVLGANETTRERLRDAHSALADVKNCRIILQELIDELRLMGYPLRSWEDLWLVSEEARRPKVMPFGKHQGLPIGEVPRDYKIWLLKQPDVDPYLRQALEA